MDLEKMRSLRWIRRKGRLFWLMSILITFLIVKVSGIMIHLFELDFETEFKSYPLDIKNFPEFIGKRIQIENAGSDAEPDSSDSIKPINSYDHRFIIKNENKCKVKGKQFKNREDDGIRLVLMVKSAIINKHRRDAIRKSWGFETRFSDVEIRRLFVIGSCQSLSDTDVNGMVSRSGHSRATTCQDLIDEESDENKDLVQADFIDSYYNNTIKTMIGLKWLNQFCSDAKFVLFVDDDYYVSTKNLLKFLRNPFKDLKYNQAAQNNDLPLIEGNQKSAAAASIMRSKLLKVNDADFNDPFEEPNEVISPPDTRLYAGYVFPSSSPMRHAFSKWFIDLSEYPYSKYPSYVTAGAFVLSNQAFKQFFTASRFIRHFRFDDIFMGILSHKLHIKPCHNDNFFFWRKSYSSDGYASVIASHGFSNPKELVIRWEEQKSIGNS